MIAMFIGAELVQFGWRSGASSLPRSAGEAEQVLLALRHHALLVVEDGGLDRDQRYAAHATVALRLLIPPYIPGDGLCFAEELAARKAEARLVERSHAVTAVDDAQSFWPPHDDEQTWKYTATYA
jgi:hypothetical protein